MPGPNLKDVQSVNEFDSIIKGLPASKACFVDFTATWCPPCKMIGPIFEKHAGTTPHAQFLKVDVDRLQPVAARYGIRAMPTFIVIKGGQKVGEMMGANPAGLANLIKTHAGAAPPAGSSSTGAGAGAGAGSSASAPAEPGVESLLPQVHTAQLTCLNESADHGIKSIVGSGAGKKGSSYLESESDPELLVYLPFNQPVKIKSISFFSGISPPQGPKTVQLFINQPQFDFADADSHEPTQELVLSEGDVKGGNRIDLRFVRFQNVNSLHILVKDNQGDEETTRIDSFDVYGSEVLIEVVLPSAEEEEDVAGGPAGFDARSRQVLREVLGAAVDVAFDGENENGNENEG
ncbi:PITH domain-containing protein [Filobasidium floriforme]|uniref:PITH domain-containing protein n=1 Tax=Filobasidium floriforme TaxID=5210 RepID=UPI001E8E088A|nr:PITH domain-containing protein [Filobasidium floriforme]KAH8088995.1 PITH domain-containing protein [Filobasidium floriforme]